MAKEAARELPDGCQHDLAIDHFFKRLFFCRKRGLGHPFFSLLVSYKGLPFKNPFGRASPGLDTW